MTHARLIEHGQLEKGLVNPLASIIILKHLGQLFYFSLDVLQSFFSCEIGCHTLASEGGVEGAHEILMVEPKRLVMRVRVEGFLNQCKFCSSD